MTRFIVLAVLTSLGTLLVDGCTALNFSDMIQPATTAAATCSAKSTSAAVQLYANPQPQPNGEGNAFAYLLPPAIVADNDNVDLTAAPLILGGFARPKATTTVSSFADYSEKIETSSQRILPKALQGDPVVIAFTRAMIKASAQAQVAAAVAVQIPQAEAQVGQIAQYQVPSVSPNDVKAFAKNLVTTQLRPTIAPPSTNKTGKNTNVFATYFSTFYNGKFVDRFGQTISKPNLSLPGLTAANGPINLSIKLSDAEIGAALTVLIEYLADLVDPTPVLGSSPPGQIVSSGADATTFYPAGNKSEPTALVAGIANYKQVSSDCGITAKNVEVLGYVANGAGDEAQLVNGLVTQSAGGFGFSLGIFGKISIGDNQTLGTVVKTAASRAAMRIVFASSYWALESAGGETTAAHPDIMPRNAPLEEGNPSRQDVGGPNGYLHFSTE